MLVFAPVARLALLSLLVVFCNVCCNLWSLLLLVLGVQRLALLPLLVVWPNIK